MTPLQETRTFDTIRSLTNDLVSQKISDTVTTQIPLISLMDKVGNKELESGGYQYRQQVLVELNQAQAYRDNDILDNDFADGVTVAIFRRKQITVPIVLSGTQMLQNSGNDQTALVDFIAAQMQIAELAMKQAIGGTTLGIMSALGEGDNGITGLRNLLTDSTTTGTCGGLSRATYSTWQHQTDSVATGFNTDGLVSMNNLWLACQRGEELPGVAVFTNAGFANLIRALQANITYNQPSPNTAFGEIGFDHINYMGAICLHDVGVTSQRAYFLNLKYLKLLVHKDRDMAIRDFITPPNQDGLVGRLYWAGNLVTNNLARQGLLQGLPDTWA